jgi:hypothetical protein
MSAAVIPLALATIASPLPLVILLLVLLTPRAVRNGLAFATGWAGALLGVGVATVLAIQAGAVLDERSRAVSVLEAVLGVGLVCLALREWIRRPRDGAAASLPGWLTLAHDCTPQRALGLGIVLVVANPKTLALTVTAAGAVAGSGASSGSRAWALVLFAVVGSAGVAVPLFLRIALGSRADGTLTRWRMWLVTHGTPGACAVLGGIGCLLVARAVTG